MNIAKNLKNSPNLSEDMEDISLDYIINFLSMHKANVHYGISLWTYEIMRPVLAQTFMHVRCRSSTLL